jgi:putative endonuclease
MAGSSCSKANETPSTRRAAAGDARRRAGAEAEDIAARHLEAHGLRILARNYRCRMGELDLVAEDRGALVFVEVRLRTSRAFGGAAESITAHKRRRMLAAARHYLLRSGADQPMRFDAVLLDRLDAAGVRWLRDVMSG